MSVRRLSQFLILPCLLCLNPVLTAAYDNEVISLIDYVSLALLTSDAALDQRDMIDSAALDIDVAASQFRPKLVPLANYGVVSGSASQSLGLEVQTTLPTGSNTAFGVVGHRIANDDFAIANSHQARTYVRVSQPLFRRWGERYNRHGLTRAELSSHKQSMLGEQARQEIILNSVQRYYVVLLSRTQLSLAEKALERSRHYLESAIARNQVGLVAKTDVFRAELAMLRAETSVLEQSRAVEMAEESLKENISRSADWHVQLDQQITSFVPVIPENWHDIVPTSRPEWQAQQIDSKLAEHNRFRAERNLLPDLSINAQYEQKGLGNSFQEARHLDESGWSVQLQLHSSLDKAGERAALSKARMVQAKLARDANALMRRIDREVRQAFQNMATVERRLQISQISFEQSEKALDLALLRYERGLSDNAELLDAESTFATAETDIIQNRVTYNIEAARLARALGVLNMEWLALSVTPVDTQIQPLSQTGLERFYLR